MYIQWFVKGIAGPTALGRDDGLDKFDAFSLISMRHGIVSNWWRNQGTISPQETQAVLTPYNLDRHLHDYQNFGSISPFISLASGCVERDMIYGRNNIWSAVDTALDFATDCWMRPGTLFYGWTIVGLNPAVELGSVSEAVRELNTYQRWSPYQLEGEITAKVNIPANQIFLAEWWDGSQHYDRCVESYLNPDFVSATPITNIKGYF